MLRSLLVGVAVCVALSVSGVAAASLEVQLAAQPQEVKAIRLISAAFSDLALAQRRFAETNDLDALNAATAAFGRQLDAAGKLQRAWARTVLSALRRDRIAAPGWLKGMAR